MKSSKISKEQIKMLVLGFLGLLMLAIRAPVANLLVIGIGAIIFIFAAFIFYREIMKKHSVGIKEKLVSISLIAGLIALSVVMIFTISMLYPGICILCGILIISWGTIGLIDANLMGEVYLSVVFAVAGIIILFSASKQSDTIVHIAGIMLCYYEISSYLKDK